jgi:phosphoserine phosphatase
MDSLADFIRMENDPWFKKGREEATKERYEQFVESLLKNTDFDAAKIAMLAGVPVELVEEVRQRLN